VVALQLQDKALMVEVEVVGIITPLQVAEVQVKQVEPQVVELVGMEEMVYLLQYQVHQSQEVVAVVVQIMVGQEGQEVLAVEELEEMVQTEQQILAEVAVVLEAEVLEL
tara:strand:- start:184 stop:510 length:327 start_codon:yes stop_codon:yes gene_type:complete